MRSLAVAMRSVILVSMMACENPCTGIVGCHDGVRTAIEGRVLNAESGNPVPGTILTVIATNSDGLDSTTTETDSQGLFSAVVPFRNSVNISLRVRPPGLPGYFVRYVDCPVAVKWGDGCVLPPIVAQPNFPNFRFLYRNDADQPAARVRVTFVRRAGTKIFGPAVADSFSGVTNDQGYLQLMPPGVFGDGLDPVIGDLTVDLPAPIGRTVRQDYGIEPIYTYGYGSRLLSVQLTGPSLSYIFVFSDSATGARVSDVEVRYARNSGIALDVDTFTVRSNSDGLAFFRSIPLASGSVTGDFRIQTTGGPVTTLANISLPTFDLDSSLVARRFLIGATGAIRDTDTPGGG
jgi:hypothetical protein